MSSPSVSVNTARSELATAPLPPEHATETSPLVVGLFEMAGGATLSATVSPLSSTPPGSLGIATFGRLMRISLERQSHSHTKSGLMPRQAGGPDWPAQFEAATMPVSHCSVGCTTP